MLLYSCVEGGGGVLNDDLFGVLTCRVVDTPCKGRESISHIRAIIIV